MLLKVIFHIVIIPFADVLGLYKLQDKTVFCYIHILQNQVPSANVLRLCKLQAIMYFVTYIYYKIRFLLQMCWGCVRFWA